MDTRIEREKSFHNERFDHNKDRSRFVARNLRGVTQDALDITYEAIRRRCPNATVLDYGCAQGESSFICLRQGAAFVHGIDISEVAIEQARGAATEKGFTQVRFEVMNAECLTFQDAQFDLICGFGILHHLNMKSACRELARVLNPSGAAVFLEPLGHNPAINLFRRATPDIRTPDEHPLLMADIRELRNHFNKVEARFVNFMTLATVPLGGMPSINTLRRLLATGDRWMFRLLPFTRRFAWNVVLELSSPIRQ